MIDLLLPHATWGSPPERPTGSPTYADWLIAFFDRWFTDSPPTRVRLFEAAINLVLGGRSTSEQLGSQPVGDGRHRVGRRRRAGRCPEGGLPGCRSHRLERAARRARRGAGGSGRRRAADRSEGAVRRVPVVPGRRPVRRRALRAQIPPWRRGSGRRRCTARTSTCSSGTFTRRSPTACGGDDLVSANGSARSALDDLGSGLGGAEAVRMLRDSRYSRHVLLLEYLLTCLPGDPEPLRESAGAIPSRGPGPVRRRGRGPDGRRMDGHRLPGCRSGHAGPSGTGPSGRRRAGRSGGRGGRRDGGDSRRPWTRHAAGARCGRRRRS